MVQKYIYLKEHFPSIISIPIKSPDGEECPLLGISLSIRWYKYDIGWLSFEGRKKIQKEEYALNNVEKIKIARELHYDTNKEKILQKCKQYSHSLEGMFSRIKTRCRRKNIKLLLSLSDFISLREKALCHYCGDTLNTTGLDRIDSNGPYSLDNCVPCCSKCNYIKGDVLTLEETKAIIIALNVYKKTESIPTKIKYPLSLPKKEKQSIRVKYAKLLRVSKKRKLAVNISLQEYSKYIENKVCFYCGADISKYGYGLDRIDASLGYSLGNIVPCCSVCNNLRCDTLTFEETIVASRAIQHLRNNKEVLHLQYSEDQLEEDFNYFKNNLGDFDKMPRNNRIIYTFQPHFFEKEKELWKNKEIRRKLINNRCNYLSKKEIELTPYELLTGFKKSGIHHGFSHFSPFWVKAFIEKYNIKSIYDPCAGWGHRLLGSLDITYIGNDVDPRTCSGLKKIINYFNIPNKTIYNEDASKFIPKEVYDAVFTCPPYFDTENYTYAETSHKKYATFQNWLVRFWNPLVDNSLLNCNKIFAFVISEKYKEMLKQKCNNTLEFVEELLIGKNQAKNHLTGNKPNEWLVIYKIKGTDIKQIVIPTATKSIVNNDCRIKYGVYQGQLDYYTNARADAYNKHKKTIESRNWALLTTLEEYNKIREKHREAKILCDRGHEFTRTFDRIETLTQCPECIGRSNKGGAYLEKLSDKGWVFISGTYENNQSVLTVKCQKCGKEKINRYKHLQEFSCVCTPENLMSGKCSTCGLETSKKFFNANTPQEMCYKCYRKTKRGKTKH